MKNLNNNENLNKEFNNCNCGYAAKEIKEKKSLNEFNHQNISVQRMLRYTEELNPDNSGTVYYFPHYLIKSKDYIDIETEDTNFVEVTYLLQYREDITVLMKKEELKAPGFKLLIDNLIKQNVDFLNRSMFPADKKPEDITAYRKLMTLICFRNKYRALLLKYNDTDGLVLGRKIESGHYKFFVIDVDGNYSDNETINNKENYNKENNKTVKTLSPETLAKYERLKNEEDKIVNTLSPETLARGTRRLKKEEDKIIKTTLYLSHLARRARCEKLKEMENSKTTPAIVKYYFVWSAVNLFIRHKTTNAGDIYHNWAKYVEILKEFYNEATEEDYEARYGISKKSIMQTICELIDEILEEPDKFKANMPDGGIAIKLYIGDDCKLHIGDNE